MKFSGSKISLSAVALAFFVAVGDHRVFANNNNNNNKINTIIESNDNNEFDPKLEAHLAVNGEASAKEEGVTKNRSLLRGAGAEEVAKNANITGHLYERELQTTHYNIQYVGMKCQIATPLSSGGSTKVQIELEADMENDGYAPIKFTGVFNDGSYETIEDNTFNTADQSNAMAEHPFFVTWGERLRVKARYTYGTSTALFYSNTIDKNWVNSKWHICLSDAKYKNIVAAACWIAFSEDENTDTLHRQGNPSRQYGGVNCCVQGASCPVS